MAEFRRNSYGRQGCCPQPQPEPSCPPAGQMPPQMPGLLDKMPLAMAYVPWQQWTKTYELERALSAGTIFPELDKPFMGVRKGGCAK